MKQFRKFDSELKKITLDENYVFAYTKSDGFTERLLNATLTVDLNYNYEFELSAFNHEMRTKNNSNSIIERGKTPDQIIKFIEDLLKLDYLSLKNFYDYESFSVTDIGMQQYLINLEKTTINIHIVDGLTEEYFTNDEEKLLFKFNDFMKKYTEDKYQNWLK